VTPPGESFASELVPFEAVAEVEEALAETSEGREWLEGEGRIGIGLGQDPRPPLSQLGIAGVRLSCLEVLSLVRLCRASGAVRRALGGRGERWPRLAARAEALPELTPLAEAIEPHIGPVVEILDSASSELRRLRRRSASVISRVREILEGLLRRAGEALSDQFITERNGRHVLPVRADSPAARRGIVHGVSSSGATVFLEPLETIELNNELVAIREQEAAEIEKILQEWTARLAGRREDLETACAGVASLDLIFARAALARDMKAVRPVVAGGSGLRLRGGRHPILEETLARQGGEVVPLSLALKPDELVLVISGPNTGGKTVALKTVGLLAVMAHCGLHVPAAEMELPPLRQVQVDIGDRQSIAESLSTFSAHIEALARMLRELQTPCLVLLDEVGTGTDPAEGVALATALLEELMARGATVIVTTHHGGLKAWAYSTPGVGNAAVEFDEERLRPTYRLLAGVAGASSGLTIAERLGLDRRVVESARARVSVDTRQSEDLLARLRHLLGQAEADREAAAQLRNALDAERAALRYGAETDERRRKEDLSRQAARVLEDFHRKAAALMGGLKDRREVLKLDRERARREGELRREVASRMQEMGIGVSGETGRVPAGPPAPGTKVRVVSLGRDGIVEEADDEGAFVRIGQARMRVRLEDCRLPEEDDDRTASPLSGLPAGISASILERDDVPGELFLLGNTVDEALEKLDKFLDDTFLAGRLEVRIIHGHGTGRLRTAVRQFLSAHRQVESHRPGLAAEGGSGATVARMKR